MLLYRCVHEKLFISYVIIYTFTQISHKKHRRTRKYLMRSYLYLMKRGVERFLSFFLTHISGPGDPPLQYITLVPLSQTTFISHRGFLFKIFFPTLYQCVVCSGLVVHFTQISHEKLFISHEARCRKVFCICSKVVTQISREKLFISHETR